MLMPMTNEQVETALAKYREKLSKYESKRFTLRAVFPSPADVYAHAVWMCEHIPAILPESREKAMRWLGFVQGCLWVKGVFTIDEMKDDNR